MIDPAQHQAFAEAGVADFVSLGTFRRSGAIVRTPVWIAPWGDRLVVTTERSTGKVKRLRNDPRVVLAPCGRTGRIREGAREASGVATILTDPAEVRSATAALRRDYGVQLRLVLGLERLVRRIQRRPGDRVILAIAPA
ncbi:PPOX class F420-dependent oxidoreductase [Agrococcus sp. SL85]|uniref:PPOX class F420-dependent oxidoreductase n=1 Tax=Agrococcus sp. SL85 TaxID=2995141 RepID=UPI00226D3F14|nr:PPOX class F420-dependent oxidoreductase [Agrococcus sp. SL85]WAC65445.1 PPOX class F420-dependent oxidoreductase [Agrococcus sp. SL85]